MTTPRRKRCRAAAARRTSDWRTTMVALLLMAALQLSQASKMIHTLDLHPTAQLGDERIRRSLGESPVNGTSTPSHWFHPRTNAVYATLPKVEDSSDEDEELQDFHNHRHLSRWERQYRIKRKLDLETEWDGIYRFEDDSREMQETTQIKAQSLKGGRYDHYAAAPLSQGYGTHYANVWVGSPRPQRKSVIVDTGSHYTAFPCKGCINCGQEHHTDPYYDFDVSETFKAYDCKHCTMGAACNADGRCIFSQAYTEGSSWEAFQADDMFYVGGRDMLAMNDPRNTEYSIRFMFGCQVSENGLFVTQLADGIMGMSAHEFTLTKRLFDSRKIDHNMFSLCFRRELGATKMGVTAGVMTLGGIDDRLDESPMLFAKNTASTGWFTVYVKNIFIRAGGGQSATSQMEEGQHVLKIPLDLKVINSGKGVIVDSGTTDTYLHKKLAKSFGAIWKTVTKKEYSHNGFLLSDEQLKRLPTILVQMRAFTTKIDRTMGSPDEMIGYVGNLDPVAPHDVMLAVPATSYMEYSPTTGLYTSRLYFTETQGGVLGANAMQGHNVVFDWENGRVGFSESACDFNDEHASVKVETAAESEGGRFGHDCKLDSPILSRNCAQSVDVNNYCSGANDNRILVGSEIWTRRIDNEGSETGLSCPETVVMETPYQGDTPPTVACKDGLCEEIRPCQIACRDVPFHKAFADNKAGSLCRSSWSVCSDSCVQSLVQSVEKKDGACYEVNRKARQCHKGACGKDDPCRVPYMVHAIFGFRSANAELWTDQSAESLAQSLVDTMGPVEQDKRPFSVGDVNVLMTSPWTIDERRGDQVNKVNVGLKVVLQISFFNVHAKLVEPTEDEPEDGQIPNGYRRILNKAIELQQHLFRRGNKPKSTCIESDLFPLANSALVVDEALHKEDFMQTLIEHLKHAEGENGNRSPFVNLFDQNHFIAESSVLSSWTIRTEVEQEVVATKALLERTPLAQYELSGRSIWLGMTGICVLFLYAADRYLGLTKDSTESKERPDDDDPEDDGNETDEEMVPMISNKSLKKSARPAKKVIPKQENEEILFQQLFRPYELKGHRSESNFSEDDLSQASQAASKAARSTTSNKSKASNRSRKRN